MKKSEAITVIEKRLIEMLNVYSPEYIRQYANLILNDLENLGMLPPHETLYTWENE